MSENNALSRLEQSLATGRRTDSIDDFLSASDNPMLLVDASYSMDTKLHLPTCNDGKGPTEYPYECKCPRAIDKLREVVAPLKGQLPWITFGGRGDGFGHDVRFVDDVPEPGGGTPLAEAIDLAKAYGANKVVVVSDGAPNDRARALASAQAFGGRIDVVFVGAPGDDGSVFLEKLAQATGGTRQEGDLLNTKQLTTTIAGLLEGTVEVRTPIQGEGFSTVAEDDVVEAVTDDDFEDDDTDEEDDDDDEN